MWTGVRKFVDTYAVSVIVYLVVAAASALAEWTTFFVLQKLIGALIAAIAAFFCATPVNYVLSRALAFNSRRSGGREIVLLFLLSAFAFAFNFVAFACLYAVRVDPMIAKVIGTCVGFGANYAFRQFIIFSPAPRFGSLSRLLSTREMMSEQPVLGGPRSEQ